MAYLLNGSQVAASRQLVRVFESDPEKGKAQIHEVCDQLLDPTKLGHHRLDAIEWLKLLFAEDEGFEKFSKKVQNMDSSSLCGCVWTANFVAYRCRTCATSSCMSLCAACFEKGNHAGHDYNIFRSEAGGACDCGDASVMYKSGFCSHHGPNRITPEPQPQGFLSAGKVILDRIFLTLIHLLRKYSADADIHGTFIVQFHHDVERFFEFILDLIKLGSPVRSHVAELLLNETLYGNIMQSKGYKCLEDDNSAIQAFHKKSVPWLYNTVNSFKKPMIPPEIKDFGQFDRNFQYKCYLDEITFWIVRYEFPESLILIILNLLPDADVKREFSRCFTRHYSRIALSLSDSAKVDQLSNRVVHISVQLFSNEELAYMLATEENLLQVFMVSMHNIIFPNLESSSTSDSDFHQCVSTTSNDIRSNSYWPIVSDFVNILSHQRVTRLFLGNPELVSCWLQQILCFCGMSLNHRAMERHIEYEPEPSHTLLAFYSEREACASAAWCMLDLLQKPDTAHLSVSTIHLLLDALTELFDALGFESDLPYDQISFHYPLHRYLALFLSNTIKNQGLTSKEFQFHRGQVEMLLAHPLQVVTTMHEIQCDMWVRNGGHMITQSLAYKQYFFCKFFIDADYYMLQFCASLLPADRFVATVFERCRVLECLTVTDVAAYHSHKGAPSEEKQQKMFESAFNILLTVCAVKTHIGLSDEELVRSEIIALLTVKPCTYSTVSDHIPQSHESHTGSKMRRYTNLIVQTLENYATKREGDAMEQTTYVPNFEAWNLYDPVFTQHRTLYKKDLQKAHSGYVQFLRNSRKIELAEPETSTWPPYQPIHDFPEKYKSLSGLLHSPLLHGIIFIVLYNNANVTDNTIAMALHLLGAALRIPAESTTAGDMQGTNRGEVENSWYSSLISWFDGADPSANMMKMIEVKENAFTSGNSPSQTSTPSRNTKECMSSLLLKLYDKYTGKRASFVFNDSDKQTYYETLPVMPSTRVNVICSVLHTAAAVSKKAEQTIRVISKSMAPSSLSTSPAASSGSSTFDSDERARRRRKAKEAQQRLMRQLAQEQKQFVESAQMDFAEADGPSIASQSLTDVTIAESASSVSPRDWGLVSMSRYECVICGMVETELEAAAWDASEVGKKIMCVICLAQSSAVLGHRTDSHRKVGIQKPGAINLGRSIDCRSHVLSRNRLCSHFASSKQPLEQMNQFSEQNLLATAIGTHISTCGHHVHLSCHQDYIDSVRQDEMSLLNHHIQRGFRCPLCRQTSNVVIPCNIRPRQINTHQTLDYRDEISKAWLETLSDIATVNESSAMGAIIAKQVPNTLNMVALASSIVRYNLEHHLMQLNNTLLSPVQKQSSSSPKSSTFKRKLPVGPLFVLLYRAHKVNGSRETRDRNRAHITRISHRLQGIEELSSFTDVSLLLKDPITLLLQLTLDAPLLPSHFDANVQLLFHLAFVKALVHVSCKFSHEERRAWKNNVSASLGGIPFSADNLECLLGLVIRLLPSQLYQPVEESISHMIGLQGMGYTMTVFSPQSVFASVENMMLDFLRLSALFRSHIFDDKSLPISSPVQYEFGHLAAYLGLCQPGDVESTDVMKCLKWGKPSSLITRWCAEISNPIRSDPNTARKLLTGHRHWLTPKLIDLPQEYSSMFQLYRLVKCKKCGIIPKEPAVCLACGAYLCYKTTCNAVPGDNDDLLTVPFESSTMHATCRHAQRCGAGTCIVLLINSSIVVVIRGSRACVWGTLYLDAHGEEDRGWKRGKPLFLKKERLELLQEQWIQHSFDNWCKDWTRHTNRL